MNQKIIYSSALLVGLGSSQAFAHQEKAHDPQKPNIIFIMCDDMGYGDLGCYGQPYISTPNIDNMAREGMRFTQAYAGSPVSAPSRACFMTGQHSGHTHVRGNKEYWQGRARNNMFGNCQDFWIVGQEPYLMTHKILPELMHEAGYTVGMFGKWAGGYWNYDHPEPGRDDKLAIAAAPPGHRLLLRSDMPVPGAQLLPQLPEPLRPHARR